MGYGLVFSQRALRFIKKLDKHERKKIHDKTERLGESPKKQGEILKYTDLWKLRVEDYRIIYKINDREKKIFVLIIGHRKNIYDNFSRLLI